jgi:hypothetical protein
MNGSLLPLLALGLLVAAYAVAERSKALALTFLGLAAALVVAYAVINP